VDSASYNFEILSNIDNRSSALKSLKKTIIS